MKQRGKRIRPSGKDLVFHFTIASLLPVFLLVVGLFHVKTIQQINWQDFNLSQADKIDIPYLIISFSVAILICLLVAFVFKRVRYDTVKQLPPCRRGRVSSANTRMWMPRSAASRKGVLKSIST